MRYYFERSKEKGFRGRERTTIVTTINRDIRLTSSVNTVFQLRELKSLDDLEYARQVAQDRIMWRHIVRCVSKVAEVKYHLMLILTTLY